MNLSQCKHIRIRGNSDYSVDVDKFIRSLEVQYKIDIRSVSHWQDVIKSLYNAKSEMKRKVRNASFHKKNIIEKLYVQNYRPSPFLLTDKLARTAKLWHEIQLKNKKKRVVDIIETSETMTLKDKDYTSEEFDGEISDDELTVHPNTQAVESKATVQPEVDQDVKSECSFKLPANICTNPHKLISLVGSHCTPLSYHSIKSSIKNVCESIEIGELLEQTKFVRCSPKEIKIYNEHEQSVKFVIRNCITECVFVRFKELANSSSLKKFKLSPDTPVKLCPGLSKTYCLNFKLMPNVKIFETLLSFKIARVCHYTTSEMLNVPFSCDYNERRSIDISETVVIPPVYPWQLTGKYKYPVGYIIIHVKDDYHYHLHIVKREVNWYKLLADESINSLEVATPNTESVMQRNEDVESESALVSFVKFDHQVTPDETIDTIDIVSSVLNEVINISLQPFYLKSTYLYLHPHSVQKIQAYFTRPEHVGPHQCCYNFEFYNPDYGSLVMSKTVKILSEILPHPVQIRPVILDMTKSPVKHGIYIDNFTIVNSHISVPVTIRIKLTAKMKKLFCITPLETLIPAQSEVAFEVQLCPRKIQRNYEDSVHFTIKIIVIGEKTVYENAPPIFYELIVPCASEFKRIYGKKYFSESPVSSFLEVTS